MTAGILETDTMFSVKQKPWHGLGTVLENAPTIEEGIKQAGLDWTVSLKNLQTDTGLQINFRKAVVKNDDTVLGVVSNGYKPVQNIEAFNFFEPFIENNMATLETAGSLFNGKKVFVLAKINQEDIHVTDEDIVEKYILLSNSHDGSQALRIGYTPIRVVCNNTLSCAISNKESELIRVFHKGNVVQTMTDIRETMDLINQQFIATEEKYKELAKKDINKLDLHNYVKQVFSSKSLEDIINQYDEKQEIENYRKKLCARVEEIFDLEHVHNAWTAYNSVNYYLNHEKGRTLDNRYNLIWFGDSKKLDYKAFNLALNI